MNVAYHLNQLGVPAGMISRVGTDDLASELLGFLKEKRIPTELIQVDEQYPTGTVQVTINASGHPAYEIVQPSAWDYIACEEAAVNAVEGAAFFVFGSLVARNPVSEATLLQLITSAKYRVFDVNLRQPFFSPRLIGDLLEKADLVKMNDDELHTISGWFGLAGDEPESMKKVLQKFDLQGIIVTRGEHGAAFLDKTGYYETPGTKVTVQDTIGSGDAFLAGFLSRKLKNADPETCLAFAGKMGAFVATQKGGTPEHAGLSNS